MSCGFPTSVRHSEPAAALSSLTSCNSESVLRAGLRCNNEETLLFPARIGRLLKRKLPSYNPTRISKPGYPDAFDGCLAILGSARSRAADGQPRPQQITPSVLSQAFRRWIPKPPWRC